MNLANALTVIFCLMSAGVTYWIFQMTWYTKIGTRKPIKNLDWGVSILMLPLCLALLGTWSIMLDSDWTNPIQLMPKVVGMSVWATLLFSFVKWFRAPDPMEVTLECFLRRQWPEARSLLASEYKEHIGDDPELNELFNEGNALFIPNASLTALYFVFTDYLVSIGHMVKQKDPLTVLKLGQWSSLSFWSENDGDKFTHIILYSEITGIATFNESTAPN